MINPHYPLFLALLDAGVSNFVDTDHYFKEFAGADDPYTSIGSVIG